MIRLSELKLPLSALPLQLPRAADAPAETDADRHLLPHPDAVLCELVAQALDIPKEDIATLNVFKRSFDARKQNLLVVYIVDIHCKVLRKKHNCCNSTPRIRRYKPRRTWCGVHLCKRLPIGVRLTASARWWSASALAACLLRWCWRKWA